MGVSFSSYGTWPLPLPHPPTPPPNTQCPHIHPLSQPCDVGDKTELKDQRSKSPRSNTWGYVSGDIVTFTSTAHSSIPPFSHCWSIHHSDRLFNFCSELSGLSTGGGWRQSPRKGTEGKGAQSTLDPTPQLIPSLYWKQRLLASWGNQLPFV